MKIPNTREGRRALIRKIASSGKPEDIKPGRPISEEFWELPWPEDPKGLALKGFAERPSRRPLAVCEILGQLGAAALIFKEPASDRMASLVREDGNIAVWWGTWVECAVAISRLKREEGFDDDTEDDARARLDRLTERWYEVEPTEGLRLLAMIVFRDHHLKVADCLQLAAALRWCEGDATGTGFVCLDDRLRRAAQDEGFNVLPEPLEA